MSSGEALNVAISASKLYFDNWRSSFDTSCIERFMELERETLHSQIPKIAGMLPKNRTDVPTKVLKNVFGDFHSSHSFSAPFLDWRMTLSEPTVTRTLADFLNEGSDELEARRIHAFLTALQVPELPELSTLAGCIVQAEVDRIDLEIWIPCSDTEHFRPVIVEAKFGHKITNGQLKKYTDARKNDTSLTFKDRHCVVLGLAPKAMKGVVGRQNNVWKFVAWRDLWLRFEKLRPRENNPSFNIFLRLLWHRIGELK